MTETSKKWLIWILILVPILLIIYSFVSASQKKIERKPQHLYSVADPEFARTMSYLIGPTLLPGHRIQTLVNGKEVFPSMLEAIRQAKKTVNFETYIYWSGKVGKMFSDALSERARAGVKTNVLLDWVGSTKMEKSLLKQMQDAGVNVIFYRPLSWYNLDRMNNRTHRKILVVDGKIGFTGGVGVADHWLGDAESLENWRDTHFRFEGPAVAQLQSAFTDNWLETTGVLLHGEEYFPPIELPGTARAQVIRSSPQEGSESIYLMYMLSLTSASKEILISNAYFVPDDFFVETLVDARKRGVTVRIILPGEITDADTVRQASRSKWGPLLQAGVEIFEYAPTMYHCKVLVVDRLWVSVGSTNFDNRSFKLNDEVNLNILDADFAVEQIPIFEKDVRKSRRVTYEQWKNRSLLEKFLDSLSGLLEPQL